MGRAGVLSLCFLWFGVAPTVELRPETVQGFDRYIREADLRFEQRRKPDAKFLWVDEDPQRPAQVREGRILIESRGKPEVPDGLVHDWIGAAFIPGVSLEKVLRLAQDYNNHKNVYRPEVVDSRLLNRNGNDFKIYMRLLKKKVITVMLDTDHDVHYLPLDNARCQSRSYTTRISEIENPGKPGERTLPAGKDHGFLWRLNSYWTFQERDGGVYVECEAISLTRAIPAGLGWLIEPIVKGLPRESLTNTLREMRDALKDKS